MSAAVQRKAVVFGASGYTGLELARLLARHPRVQVVGVTSDRWLGEKASARLGPGLLEGLSFIGHEAGMALAASVDVALLATPAESSLALVPKLLQGTAKVIDLSGAFRLADVTQYPAFYGFEHSAPNLLPQAWYGLPELTRSQRGAARLVSNPGCYATAAALALAPLLKAGIVSPLHLVVSAASGVSGAGRKASEDFSFMEVGEDFRAYKVLRHQHSPEIAQTLSRAAGTPVGLVFTPHLLPLRRGILCTAVATLSPNATAASVKTAFADAYACEPLMQLCASADAVRLADAARTPRCLLGASVEGDSVVVVTAIDNLLKGAASQAVQNLNALFGFEETEGLLS